MSLLIASRTAQWPLVASFTFEHDDTMVNTAGATVDFGLTNTAASNFDIIPLPVGAVILKGQLITEEAFDAATYAVIIGDSGTADRYLTTADRKGTALVDLVPTGYRSAGENLRIRVTAADACSTGKMTVRIEYIIVGRSNEVQIT